MEDAVILCWFNVNVTFVVAGYSHGGMTAKPQAKDDGRLDEAVVVVQRLKHLTIILKPSPD
jgi:hypothetical protein